MLRPQNNAFREAVPLDGLWNFSLGHGEPEEENQWKTIIKPRCQVPVPASYNDIFMDSDIHDHVGWVYYQRTVFVPRGWTQDRIFIRVDAATHTGRVYINDEFLIEHQGGYTPFEIELTQLVKAGASFRLTIAVNNELSATTIPPGEVKLLPNGKRKQQYQHDFFNFSGLTRSVWLYCTPEYFIKDITITTDVTDDQATGIIQYRTLATGAGSAYQLAVSLIDETGKTVVEKRGWQETLTVNSPNLWNPGNAYLYQLEARILDENEHIKDAYSIPVGVRSVKVKGNKFLINGQPFYFKGFGKHEDSPIRGKGHDPVFMVHDFELMKWTGANSFRTSHYPYAEEVLDYADRQGIVVINETAAVGLNLGIIGGIFGRNSPPTWSPETFHEPTRLAHASAIQELIARDKNRACVVLWTIANEPASSEAGAREYFEPLVKLTRELNPSRPICFANMVFAQPHIDLISDMFDVLCLNRYYGWYTETGNLSLAEINLEKELRQWEQRHEKPIIISEYGADAQPGLHSALSQPWSEEYQADLLEMYHRVFDRIDSVIGEHVWNFADFATSVGILRVDGNKKGIFTRDRKPKISARVLRKRWNIGEANK